MRIKILTSILLAFSLSVSSQENDYDIPPNNGSNVFIELFGNGLFISANYDRRFTKTGKGLGARIGLGFVPGINFGFASTSSFLTVPVGINYLLGKQSHFFEPGLGVTYVSGSASVFGSEKEKADGFIFIPSLGYRYQPVDRGFTGRIFISPLVSNGGGFWFGLSAGFKLK